MMAFPSHQWRFSILAATLASAAELLCRKEAGGSASVPSFAERRKVMWHESTDRCSLDETVNRTGCSWEARQITMGWKVEATLQGYGGSSCSVAWAPTGERLLVGNVDGSADVWQLEAVSASASGWKRLTKLVGHADAVRAVVFSPDSSMALTGSADGTVRVWTDTNSTPLVWAEPEPEAIPTCESGNYSSSATNSENVPYPTMTYGAQIQVVCEPPLTGYVVFVCNFGSVRLVQGSCGYTCEAGNYSSDHTLFEVVEYPDIPHDDAINVTCPHPMTGILTLTCRFGSVEWVAGGCGDPCTPQSIFAAGPGYFLAEDIPQLEHLSELIRPCSSGFFGSVTVICKRGRIMVVPDCARTAQARRMQAAAMKSPPDAEWSNTSYYYGPRPPEPYEWGLVAILQNQADAIWGVEWSTNESGRVLTGSRDRTGCLSELAADERGSLVACSSHGRHRGQVDSALRDSYDRTARVWRALSQQDLLDHPPQWRVEARLQDRHRHSHVVLAVAWSQDGESVLTGSADGVARVWHVGGVPPPGHGIGHDQTQWNLWGMLKAHVSEIWSVAWAPDRSHLMTGSRDGVTHIWRPSATQLHQWEVAGTLQEIRCLFTADDVVESVFYGGLNVTQNVTGDLEDWEQDKSILLSVVPGAYLVVSTRNHELNACRTGGFAMVCSNGITTANTGEWLGWEMVSSDTPPISAHQEGHGDGWGAPSTSSSTFYLPAEPLARKLCGTDEAYTVYRIRLATQAARGLATFGQRVALSASPTGVAAAGSRESYGAHGDLAGDLQRRFVETPPALGVNAFRRMGEVGTMPPAVWSAAWSPSGMELITGSRDGTARVWQLIRAEHPMQWRLASELKGHSGVVWSCAWSPDGRKVATAGQDGLTRVWEWFNKPGFEVPTDIDNATGEQS